MNWFERHLNWTTVIIFTANTCLFYIFIASTYLGEIIGPFFAFVPFMKDNMILNIGYFLSTIIVMAWILRRKSRSLLLLLFFAPLLYTIGLPIYGINYSVSSLSSNISAGIILISFLLLFIGFFVITLLPHKPRVNNNPIYNTHYLKSLLVKKISPNRYFIFSYLVTIAVMIGASAYTYYDIRYNYQTFTGYSEGTIPVCTFECPRSYFGISGGDAFIIPLDSVINMYARNKMGLLGLEAESLIIVRAWPSEYIKTLNNDFNLEKPLLLLQEELPGFFYDLPPTKDYSVKPTSIIGIPGEYITLTIVKPKTKTIWTRYYGFWGTIKAVTFEHNNSTWLIAIWREHQQEQKPDPVFDHLLETFKITEN